MSRVGRSGRIGADAGNPQDRDAMRLSWGVRTDRGRLRELNEDAVLAQPPVFVVADGMGGHAAGEVASGLVIEAFAQLARRTGSSARAEEVVATLVEVNHRILAYARAQPEAAGLGTTVSGLVMVDDGGGDTELLAFNIGDSRLYRLEDGELLQVSVDHSAVQELVSRGLLDPKAAGVHPARHIVTRALGSDPAPQPDLWLITPRTGDRFLLCTDGLSGEVTDDELHDAVLRADDPETLAQDLVELALRLGGRDNISVIVVDILDSGRDSGSTPTARP